MKKVLIFAVVMCLLFIPSGYATHQLNVEFPATITETCVNGTHIKRVTDIYACDGTGCEYFNSTETSLCRQNCTSDQCTGEEPKVDMAAMWLTFSAGFGFLILGTVLGVPFGKLVGKEDIRPGWDTTTIVRYMFFFIGFFLVYLSLSMGSRLGTVYAGDENIIGAVDTSVMVMLITMLLFLFVFFVEIIFYVLNYYMKSEYDKKWKMRGD